MGWGMLCPSMRMSVPLQFQARAMVSEFRSKGLGAKYLKALDTDALHIHAC